MASEDGSIRIQDPKLNPSTWLPVTVGGADLNSVEDVGW